MIPNRISASARRLVAAGAALLWLGLVEPAHALLPLPLFRLALEEWVPTNYQAILFYQESLSPEGEELAHQLLEAPSRSGANLEVATVDLSAPSSPAWQALWSTQTNADPPWLVLRRMESAGSLPPIWAGPLKPEAVAAVLDSPARRTVAAALLRGETAVWVLVESGNPVADEAAVDQLASNLKALEHTLRLPPAGPTNAPPRSPIPFAVSFSLVRVTRTDPAEEFFVSCLMQGVPPSPTRPAVIPVFGRGQLLPPMVGKKITAKTIQQACKRLVSPYVREPKEALPSRNLLLAARWDSIFSVVNAAPATAPVTNPPASSAPPATAAPATAPPSDPSASALAKPAASHPAWRVTLIAAALFLVGAAVIGYTLNRRRARP